MYKFQGIHQGKLIYQLNILNKIKKFVKLYCIVFLRATMERAYLHIYVYALLCTYMNIYMYMYMKYVSDFLGPPSQGKDILFNFSLVYLLYKFSFKI